MEARVQRRAQRLSGGQFFFKPLEYNDVGVHGHAHAEYDTRDARQCQLNSRYGGEQEQYDEHIDGEREIGHQAGQPVVDQYEYEQDDEADHSGKQAGGQSVLAQRRADGAQLNLLKVQRQCA
ncbi:hypothetical protein SDC9_207140 [bioreactor metagenome]|uniref:Uncharacterized protein n=1 Tax=bioreactor metagenome TaxID=1076179 RepID=A0A645J9L7_9ZZZZ